MKYLFLSMLFFSFFIHSGNEKIFAITATQNKEEITTNFDFNDVHVLEKNQHEVFLYFICNASNSINFYEKNNLVDKKFSLPTYPMENLSSIKFLNKNNLLQITQNLSNLEITTYNFRIYFIDNNNETVLTECIRNIISYNLTQVSENDFELFYTNKEQDNIFNVFKINQTLNIIKIHEFINIYYANLVSDGSIIIAKANDDKTTVIENYKIINNILELDKKYIINLHQKHAITIDIEEILFNNPFLIIVFTTQQNNNYCFLIFNLSNNAFKGISNNETVSNYIINENKIFISINNNLKIYDLYEMFMNNQQNFRLLLDENKFELVDMKKNNNLLILVFKDFSSNVYMQLKSLDNSLSLNLKKNYCQAFAGKNENVTDENIIYPLEEKAINHLSFVGNTFIAGISKKIKIWDINICYKKDLLKKLNPYSLVKPSTTNLQKRKFDETSSQEYKKRKL